MRDFIIFNFKVIKCILVFILFFPLNCLFAIEGNDSINCESIYWRGDSAIIQPQFVNGIDYFFRLNEQVAKPAPIVAGTIPAKARVFVEFGVDKQGNIFNPHILKVVRTYFDKEHDKFAQAYDKDWEHGIDFDYCQEEAFRILSLMKFIPAQKDSVAVCYGNLIAIINVYYAGPGYD